MSFSITIEIKTKRKHLRMRIENKNNTRNYSNTSKIHINKFDIGRKVSLCFLIVSLISFVQILVSFSQIVFLFLLLLAGRCKTLLNKILKLRFECDAGNETIANSHLSLVSFVLFRCVSFLHSLALFLSLPISRIRLSSSFIFAK